MLHNGEWRVTFADILTLLLTFFVFIIAVSDFKSEKYEKFWKIKDPFEGNKKASTMAREFKLIEDVKFINLSPGAENMLMEMESFFTGNGGSEVDAMYNENRVSLMISEELVFLPGKSKLSKEVEDLIDRVVTPLKKNSYKIGVEGHTDSEPMKGNGNMELSLKRAESIARLIISKGISSQRVMVSGYGSAKPVADNFSPQGRARNRRVEINIYFNNNI